VKSPLTSKASHRCAKCGHDNPAATKFCGECGAPFAAAARRDVPGSYTPRHLADRILVAARAMLAECTNG